MYVFASQDIVDKVDESKMGEYEEDKFTNPRTKHQHVFECH